MIALKESTQEECRINHGVCLARRVQIHVWELEAERKQKEGEIFLGSLRSMVCLLRLIPLIHMLRQIKQILSLPLLFECRCSCRNADNEPFYTLNEQTLGHIWILGSSASEELRSVAACLPRGGLVFQTGFVNCAFRAGSSLCRQRTALWWREGQRKRVKREKKEKDPHYHVSPSMAWCLLQLL